MGAPPPKPSARPRTIFYVDGFNLYYGAVRATPALKWLNLERYCTLLRPHDEIVSIRYFSALVTGPTRPNQENYLRALSTTPVVEVILGKFKQKNVKCGVTTCNSPRPEVVPDARRETYGRKYRGLHAGRRLSKCLRSDDHLQWRFRSGPRDQHGKKAFPSQEDHCLCAITRPSSRCGGGIADGGARQ